VHEETVAKLLEASRNRAPASPLRLILAVREGAVLRPPPNPDQFDSRIEYRRALIARQEEKAAASDISGLAGRLSNLGLKVITGRLTHTIVVEGEMDTLLKALEDDAVVSAAPGEDMELIRPL